MGTTTNSGPRLPEPAYESTASRLLRESGASPVQIALPASFSTPKAPLAPNPQGQAAVASVRNLAAEALRRSEEDWKKATRA